MAKTLILGNNPQSWWIKDLQDFCIREVPCLSANRASDITKYIEEIPKDIDKLIIDVDSLNAENNVLPLDIALNVRLMLHTCLRTSLCAIIFVSDLGLESLKGYGARSMLLMTGNVYFVTSENSADTISNATPMTPAEYVSEFLNLIKIEPREKTEGRHSIANEWGADVLNKVICGGISSEIIPLNTSSSLYFKYSSVVSLNADEVDRITSGKQKEFYFEKLKIKNSFNYLLIDDETGKGWDKALSNLMPNAKADYWSAPARCYEDISYDIRKNISDGKYQIIFLDLRMNGISEESLIKPEDFSGMKILRSIKKINPGIQVIMLTATNKGWNVQALLEAGANGYYMKESPEYHFPIKYSEQNAKALHDVIKDCLGNAYLQDICADAKNIKLNLPSDSDLSDDISSQLDIALSLILKAKRADEYAFAYLALEQIFEIATSRLISQEWTDRHYEYKFTEDGEEKCKFYDGPDPAGLLETGKGENPAAQWKKASAIYYQLYDGTDADFSKHVEADISLRNKYIHPKRGKRPVITADYFKNLFSTVCEFLSVFK